MTQAANRINEDPTWDGRSDPPRPHGLGPNAMLDSRFPLAWETSVPEGVRVLTQYFAALARRDLRGMAETLHFPFGTFEGTEPIVVESLEQLMDSPPPSLNVRDEDPERFTAHDGYLKPGSYDVFMGMEVVNSDPVHVGLAMTYYRYGSDGKKLLRCQGIYSVTNNEGRWGIELMSTIFTPADMMSVRFPDTEEISSRLRIDHDLAYQVSDRSVDAHVFQLGRMVASSGGGNEGAMWRNGPHGDIMPHFRVEGVKSRLRITENTEESLRERFTPSDDPPSDYAEYRALFPMGGVGHWGWVYGVLPETRVLHATYDKAHMASGAIRFTAAGEECSLNADLAVVTYKKGRWGRAGTLTYTTPHDRSNDVRPG